MTVEEYSDGDGSRKRPHKDSVEESDPESGSNAEANEEEMIDVENMLTQPIKNEERQAKRIRLRINREEVRQTQLMSQRIAGGQERYAGYIKRVSLRNFMSHANFQLDLGPRLNFIIGHNGSGKSAILTAICVCLGAKATDTNRGSNLKSLIKEGTNSSTITVVLANDGDEAFDQGRYGKEIIIERTIKRDNSASPYIIKSESGKKVSTKKADLEKILDNFNIAVGNPMAFLSQDAARSFLTASSDDQKFQHFMNGTQMKEIVENFKSSKDELVDLNFKLITMKETLHGLRKKEQAAGALHQRLNSSEVITAEIRRTTGKYAWVEADHLKCHIQELRQKITGYERHKKQLLSDLDDNQEKLKEIEAKKVEAKRQRTIIQNDLEDAKNTHEENRKQGEKILAISEASKNELEKANDKLKKLEAQMSRIENDIRVETEKINKVQGGSREVLEAQLTQLEQRKIEIEKNLSEIQNQSMEINTFQERERSEIQARVQELNEELRQADNYISDIRKNQNNSDPLFNYPENYRQLVKMMTENRNQFRNPPIGPLGRYVSIKPEHKEWANFIDVTIGVGLNTFIVQNYEDLQTLRRMADKCNCNAPVVSRRFERFDYSHGLPDRQFLTVLDVLEFQNEDVKYSLIDLSHIESTVLIKDRVDAQTAVESGSRNVRQAISFAADGKSGQKSSMNANGGFRIDNIHITKFQRPKIVVKNVSEDLPGLQQNRNRIAQDRDHWDSQLRGIAQKHSQQKSQLQSESSRANKRLRDVERDLYQIGKKLSDDTGNGKLEEYENQARALKEDIDFCRFTEIPAAQEKYQSTELKKERIGEEYHKSHIQSKQIKSSLAQIESYIADIDHEGKNTADMIQRIDATLALLDQKKISKNQSIIDTEDKIIKQTEHAANYCTEDEANSIESNDLQFLRNRTERLKRDLEAAQQELDKDPETIVQEYKAAKDERVYAQEQFDKIRLLREDFVKALEKRINIFVSNRFTTFTVADTDFAQSLKHRGFSGKLSFDTTKSRLSMTVKTKNDREARNVDSLSGGEKSFSQIAFLLATWKPMRSRIKALDEFDVFMDQVNRKIGMRLMLTKLSREQRSQTIFITPQDIGQIADLDDDLVRIHRIKDPRANQH